MTELERMLQPSIGYFELGMHQEANDALEELPPAVKTSREVMTLRARIYQKVGSWEFLREVGGYLARTWPDEAQHWIWLAYGTRRCRSLAEARAVLLEALPLHPDGPIIRFNLACYAAQLGNLDEARYRLASAIALDSDIRLMALDDPDLEPLWADLGNSNPQ